MKMNHKLVLLWCCMLLVSCNTSKKIVYMQDVQNGVTDVMDVNKGILIQPKDILSIVISSKDPELAKSYNLPLLANQAGGSTMNSSSFSQRMLGYQVSTDGSIDFPVLGNIQVAGMSREELSEKIKQDLRKGAIRDAIVITEFMNFKISVLGEVRSPGTIEVKDDRITILEALGRVGDLTLYGRRDNVLVRREQNGVITNYRVDLLSSAFTHSPAFYLQQNDVVYVEPNNARAATAEINQNRSVGVLLSLASLLTTLGVILFK